MRSRFGSFVNSIAFVLACVTVCISAGTSGCSSESGDGTVNDGTNGVWARGATAGPAPIEEGRHFPWEVLLPDGDCADPDAEQRCSDGDGCCPSNGVCCGDGSCAADANLCTTIAVAAGCPTTAPISCGAVCCGSQCCPDGTCDDCTVGNSVDSEQNPYASSGDDTNGGTTEPTDPGTTEPTDPDPEPSEPSCGDGQYACGDDCCDSKAPGRPVHARRKNPQN